MDNSEWTHVLLPLLTLALRLEREGQYNLAKLARAAVDSVSRRAAYQHDRSADERELVDQVEEVLEPLSRLGVDEGLLDAFRQGNRALSEGRIPSIEETPHPYVCRTCGHLVMGKVTEKCPTCGAWSDTFQWFPPIYWLEALSPLAALDKLRHTPLEIAALLEGTIRAGDDPCVGGWWVGNTKRHHSHTRCAGCAGLPPGPIL